MSYIGISIKEAMGKINSEWFLPAIQRPYVWGNRYESEKFICKLFDSLFQKYPIGGLILWKNSIRVAHREFLKDYHHGDVYKNVDEGRFEHSKSLIYDGQQRLQTLFSCLKYSFNDRLLVFNLLYNTELDEDNCTGFRFINKDQSLDTYDIKLNYLFGMGSEDTAKKTEIRRLYQIIEKINEDQSILIENNIDILWDVFVKTDSKSLAYFEISSSCEDQVNEIFERLNSGGIPLSKADLLYSKIKAKYPDFEANIMEFSKQLSFRTKLAFDSYDILQVLSLIVKGRSRIDEHITNEQIDGLESVWKSLIMPLNSFFDDYLQAHLGITHMAIVRNKIPALVLIVFFYNYYQAGKKWKDISKDQSKLIDKFFIISELNDWTLQSYADNFCRIIANNEDKTIFPYQLLENFVRNKGNRNITIKEAIFINYLWFSLKITMPDRKFEFDYSMINRFNPELDHIFPKNLNDRDDAYKQRVDVIWNMQPVKGEINNHKRNIHPLEYFKDQYVDSKGKTVYGSKNYHFYDLIPPVTDSETWGDESKFIQFRREKFIETIKNKYDIELEQDIVAPAVSFLPNELVFSNQ